MIFSGFAGYIEKQYFPGKNVSIAELATLKAVWCVKHRLRYPIDQKTYKYTCVYLKSSFVLLALYSFHFFFRSVYSTKRVIMKFYQLLVAILLSTGTVLANSISSEESINRPLAHLTPNKGWMNDPNGLFYDKHDEVWHVYYQYNPEDSVWGLPLYWGHATSKDLTTWTDHGAALAPDEDNAGVYSGSIVVDRNNTSNFFDDSTHPDQRVVAIYTYNTPESESQYLAYSIDGGYNFTKYEGNPVLDVNSTQFRDPKVFWHGESERWIMVLAKSQEYKIQIFGSQDLKTWEFYSNFSHYGLLGYQYECPGLSKVPIIRATESNSLDEEVDEKWVMFLSINPGGPLGGSFTQYFVGDFDGKQFIPDTNQINLLDLGKDYYAFQAFSSTPNDDVLGIAWASNWQYGAHVPTNPWRGSMSLVRNLTLQEFKPNPESTQLNLNSKPILDYKNLNNNGTLHRKSNISLNEGETLSFNMSGSATGLLEFSLTWKVNSTGLGAADSPDLSLYLRGASDAKEYLKLGFENNAAAFFIDRGHSSVKFVDENPFFTDKMSVNLQPLETLSSVEATYKVHGIADRNVLELYFNDGVVVSTNTFFFSEGNFVGEVEITTGVDNVYEILDFEVKQLSSKH